VFRWLDDLFGEAPPASRTALEAAVRAHLGGADEETMRIVCAVAGLLGSVAYADRDYSAVEETRIRAELGRIHGLSPPGVDAICAVLREHIVVVATVEAPVYSRELRELADPELRLEVLDTLVDLAAADNEITFEETNVLRQIATSLGLSQADYNASQERHRDKLGVLKKIDPTR
jgi:uncharacterized tellurite resistance protein B-like protein